MILNRLNNAALGIWLGMVALCNLAPATAATPQATGDVPQFAVNESFEESFKKLHIYRAEYTVEEHQARNGKKSLRMTPEKGGGAVYFKLDGLLDFSSDYEYGFWVKHGEDITARGYLSGEGEKGRYNISNCKRVAESNGWYLLRGAVRAKEWRPNAHGVMLAMWASGESLFDDAVMYKTRVPDPPIEVWPQLETQLRLQADKHTCQLQRNQNITLTANSGALAFSINKPLAEEVRDSSVIIPAEGLLTFAIDADEELYLSGNLWLEPDADLRPGLRAYVLANNTVVGAPMVRAEPWRNTNNGKITAPAPLLEGVKPATLVKLCNWRIEKGRHYITIAGPHMRPAGRFLRLELQALAQKPEKPLYSFAFITDTHLGDGRPEWMNVKMDEPAIEELGNTLAQLKSEGLAFAVIGGDMTDGGQPSQINSLREAVQKGGLPVFGAIGNHEVFTSGTRAALLAQMPELFPKGDTQYSFDKSPLRFVVLDGAWWHDKAGEPMQVYDRSRAVRMYPRDMDIAWLKECLTANTTTPTVLMWHFPFYSSRGVASSGYKLGETQIWSEQILALLEATPNVVATFNGHMHFNAVSFHKGVTHLQNAAFAEWPHLYRVCQVYTDRVEWEVRQVGNRGFVSEGFLPAKALSWMVSVQEGDLAGTFKLTK